MTDEGPVKIKADGHIQIGGEKKVAFRKRIDTATEPDDLADDPSEGDDKEDDDEEISQYGEDKFLRLKNDLIHQIDLLSEDEVEMIKFEFDANNRQLYFQVWKTQSSD